MKQKSVGLIVLLIHLAGFARSPLYSADWSFPFQESSLNGFVKSETSQPLEGILVRARREGSHIAYTVITDTQGQYRFPQLDAGKYSVETPRAEGLEPGKRFVEIKAGQEGRLDFVLGKAKNMIQQMSGVDWLLSLPATPAQRGEVQGCGGCHTLYTLMKFRFDKDSWAKVIRMMGRTHQTGGGTVYDPSRFNGRPPRTEEQVQALAEFLAKVRGPEPLDLSNAKILPRPTGRSTRAIFTEYDIPYDQAEPHDLGVAKDGTVFWTDWRLGKLGKLDPKTGEMKYWEAPPLPGKPEAHPGTFQVVFDEEDNPWTTITWTGGLVKFDRKNDKFFTWLFPDLNPRRLIMTTRDHQRGRIWFGTDDYYGDFDLGYYVPKTGEYKVFDVPDHNGNRFIYGHVVDSKGNVYALKFGHSAIDRLDAETEKFTRYFTPTPNSAPRRGDYDSQDRIWFGEYNADQIGMLDPATGKITEYKLPIPEAKPYSVNVDRRTGLVWAAEYLADRFAALDPKTGEMREYLLPTKDSQVRIIDSYSVGDHSVIWFGALPEYEKGKIVKLEAW